MSWLTGGSLGFVAAKAALMSSLLRFSPVLGKLADHWVRVLVDDGQVRERELRRCGLTDNDLFAQLRQRGVFSLDQVRYVLYEAKGDIAVVRKGAEGTPQLVEAGLEGAADYP